jgi:hypothetical protein
MLERDNLEMFLNYSITVRSSGDLDGSWDLAPVTSAKRLSI